MNWQPIRTLPDDGRTILVANALGEVCPLIRGVIHNNVGFADWKFAERITHWMPLPAPPESTDQSIDRLVKKSTEGGK